MSNTTNEKVPINKSVALVVNVDDEMRTEDFNAGQYDVIEKAVGGVSECVYPSGLEPPYCMVVNDDGHLLGLPINHLATMLYGTGYPIVGDVVFLKIGSYDGEPDVVGLTEHDVKRLSNQFVRLSGGDVRWAKG